MWFESVKFNFSKFQQLRNTYAKYTLYCVVISNPIVETIKEIS